MEHALREVAEAFSHHDFARVYDHLADDVRWRNMGGDEHTGKEAVIAACDAASAYFARVTATLTYSRTIAADAAIAVETTTTYAEGDDTSEVGSCDLYDIVADKIALISSYNVEL